MNQGPPQAAAPRSGKVFVAAIGDVNDPRTWSGIPYHFLQAGRWMGIFHAGLNLSLTPIPWRLLRWHWNALQLLLGERLGGFQYSVPFLERLWRPFRGKLRGHCVINCVQLFPPSLVEDDRIQKWFFIDQTLTQLYDDYGERSRVGGRIAREAVEREREGYRRATGIIAHSRWAAQSLLNDYGIEPHKVHVIPPGASLDLFRYLAWEKTRKAPAGYSPERALRLVFVGRDWSRKGLDLLLEAWRRLGAEQPLQLSVFGCRPRELPARWRSLPRISWRGPFDKGRQEAAFMEELSRADLGVLPSRMEAGGIVLREFQALGLGVLSTRVGGVPDHVLPETSYLLEEARVDLLERALLELLAQPRRVIRMKKQAWQQRRRFLHLSTVSAVAALLQRGESAPFPTPPLRLSRGMPCLS